MARGVAGMRASGMVGWWLRRCSRMRPCSATQHDATGLQPESTRTLHMLMGACPCVLPTTPWPPPHSLRRAPPTHPTCACSCFRASLLCCSAPNTTVCFLVVSMLDSCAGAVQGSQGVGQQCE